MLSSHRFLCLSLRFPPCTVPCRTVLASPDDRMTCPFHFSLRLFTEVRSSYGPMAFPCLLFTSSLVMWSYIQGTEEFAETSPMPVSFYQCLLLCSSFHMHTKIWTWPRNTSVWSWSWWRNNFSQNTPLFVVVLDCLSWQRSKLWFSDFQRHYRAVLGVTWS